MLKHLKDLDRLAESAIRVEHFATHDVLSAYFADPAGTVRAWMTANDFDISPVKDAQTVSFIHQSDILPLIPSDPVGSVVRTADPSQIVEPSLPLQDALLLLAEHGWLFVENGSPIPGIVTLHDLARPAVSLYLFARIISLEQSLRNLYGTVMFPCIIRTHTTPICIIVISIDGSL